MKMERTGKQKDGFDPSRDSRPGGERKPVDARSDAGDNAGPACRASHSREDGAQGIAASPYQTKGCSVRELGLRPQRRCSAKLRWSQEIKQRQSQKRTRNTR